MLEAGLSRDCRRCPQVASVDRVLFLTLGIALALVLVWSIARGWSHLPGNTLS
jgi:hypothetical protein